MSIFVIYSKDFRNISKFLPKKDYCWVYLGKDYLAKTKIKRTLGREKKYVIRDRLQLIALENRNEFINLIKDIGFQQDDLHRWWASNMAYKCPSTSDFYLIRCYKKLFEFICQKKTEQGGDILFLVEDLWLYECLRNEYSQEGKYCFFGKKSFLPKKIWLLLRGIAARGYFCAYSLNQYLISKIIMKRKETKNLRTNLRRIGLYTWVNDNYFIDGAYRDSMFERLEDILEKDSNRVTYISPLYLSKRLMKKCLQHRDFIILSKYLRIQDIIKSAMSVFTLSRKYVPEDLPTKMLIEREVYYEFSENYFQKNLLHYYSFRRMFEKYDSKIDVIIYPFENQPWDRMLCYAKKEMKYQAGMLGYQHTTIPLLWLSYFLGENEAKIMPLPDTIITNGDFNCRLLTKAGYGNARIVNGGAFRFEYMEKTPVERKSTQTRTLKIAVPLPYDHNMCNELLATLFENFADSKMKNMEFLIKYHPQTYKKGIKIDISKWPEHFKTVKVPFPDLLMSADLVLFYSSSTGLEALANGIPVIKYYSESVLDQDPLRGFDEFPVANCFADNIKEMIYEKVEGINDSGSKDGSRNRMLKDHFFAPVNENTWREAIGSPVNNAN